MTFKLRDYQMDCVAANIYGLTQHRSLINILPTGCLTGDTIISTNRGGIGRKYTLKRLYNSTNENPDNIKWLKQFKKEIPTYVRSYNGTHIQLNEALNITYSGRKPVYILTLKNGFSLRGTACHKIMTKRGWVPLGQLITNADHVMCDDMTCKGLENKKHLKIKRWDPQVTNLWHHPFAPLAKTKKMNCGYTKRIELHRAIYECKINELTLEEYKRIYRTSPVEAKKLKRVNPETHHIHHIDHDYTNNDPSNLQALPIKEHLKTHGNPQNFGQGIPTFSKVESVLPDGEDDTYDIECKAPHHNFIANGMVVHNSGKTEIFVKICEEYTAGNPDKSVLVLSHLSLLTDQTLARFKLRSPNLSVGVLQRERKPRWNNSVLISTMQTSRSKKHADWLKEEIVKDVGLIIIDEAHHIGAPSYQTILQHFPEAKTLGFTATPYRNRQIMTSFFDQVAFSISLQELIDQGHLVPPRIVEIADKSREISDVIAGVLRIYNDHEKGKQGIVFMQTIEEARLICSAFRDLGVTANAITQELRGDYRNSLLDRFSSGDIQILSTVNVLTAGFDSPAVETIYMPYGTSSPATYLQRIGRGLRPNVKQKKTHCTIYVCGDAPSVSKKVAERLTNKILNAGGAPRSYSTFQEDWEYNEFEKGSDIYVWNETVLSAIKKMKKLGMTNFADLLNKKKFPQRFLSNISELLNNLPDKKRGLSDGQSSATENQKTVLFKAGFGSAHITDLNKSEAHMMISAIMNGKNKERLSSKPQYVLPEGKHQGKQVFEVPHAYRSMVKKRFPNSAVAKTIIAFEAERKKA